MAITILGSLAALSFSFKDEPRLTHFSVAGVISGYRASTQPVYRAGEATAFESAYNTGIICAYGIKHVIRLIDQNSIGFNLMDAPNCISLLHTIETA